jgi:hypothetical protein
LTVGVARTHSAYGDVCARAGAPFALPDWPERRIICDAAAVRGRLAKIVIDVDLRRHIL